MQLSSAILPLFFQLADLLEQLSDEEYRQPMPVLSGATIGQHFRHVLECFQELERGYQDGDVNYDLRKRDRRLETDRAFAHRVMASIDSALRKPDKPLQLYAALEEGMEVSLSSTYYRELLHNLDHTVHHMALIKIGLSELPGIQVPDSFGVSHATIQHRSNNHSIHRN
jgi:uncharacterized damage-inducible protein DinB